MAGRRAPRRLRADAFAKINLDLRVIGVRPDGYHELRTTFQTIELHDTLTLGPAAGPFRIECDDATCPIDRTNLVWRAAEQIWRAARRRGAPDGVRVRIDKRIPVQAGLGGGSSDAATALRAFQALWRVKVSRDRLCQMAATLGADVPFFLEGGTAIGINRGDVLERRPDAPASWVVLVLPDFGVSTKDAFAWWDADRPSLWGLTVHPSKFGNDLEAPVAGRHPEIATIVAALTAAGAGCAAMSGSGSAVFGLFETKREASAAAAQLKNSSRRALVTRTLVRGDFRKRSRPRFT